MTFVSAGRRVVVTGLGAVTPLGSDVQTYWRRLVAGDSGIGPVSLFDASALTSRIAGEVPDFDPAAVLEVRGDVEVLVGRAVAVVVEGVAQLGARGRALVLAAVRRGAVEVMVTDRAALDLADALDAGREAGSAPVARSCYRRMSGPGVAFGSRSVPPQYCEGVVTVPRDGRT